MCYVRFYGSLFLLCKANFPYLPLGYFQMPEVLFFQLFGIAVLLPASYQQKRVKGKLVEGTCQHCRLSRHAKGFSSSLGINRFMQLIFYRMSVLHILWFYST